jgi:hypothetical protein
MTRKRDYIPGKNADFFNWQSNLNDLVSANLLAWSIPTANYDPVSTEQPVYEKLYQRITNKGTRAGSDITAYNVEKAKYVKLIRFFVKGSLAANAAITPDLKRQLQITINDPKPTKRGLITTTPFTKLTALPGGLILIECRVDSDSTRTSKHAEADGVEFAYNIVPPVITNGVVTYDIPTTPDDCTMRMTSKKARFTISLDVSNAGSKICGFARWINQSDLSRSGQWSTVLSVVISN